MTVSVTNRLRIGFAVLIALITAVSVLGVGRLFQVREDFEDSSAHYANLALQNERMRSTFVLEQAALGGPPGAAGGRLRRQAFGRAAAAADSTTREAEQLAEGEAGISAAIEARMAAETTWRRRVAKPILSGGSPLPPVDRRATTAVARGGDEIDLAIGVARAASRDRSNDDTHTVVILVLAGLLGGLLAAVVLFSGLINSMRAPLKRLVEGARNLAGGDLGTRVNTGGPTEIEALGEAFNDMASALERDARERDRVEQMKDDFLLTVSHELRTPVTSVKGFAEMLASQENSLSVSQREAVGAISEGTGDLSKLIDDLVDLARSDAGRLTIEPRPTAVKPLLERVGRQMQHSFSERGQRLQVSASKDLPRIKADPERISQALNNLLSNANKYGNEGGVVRLSASRKGKEVAIVVSDEGPGITEDELEHVFERFWRADSGVSQRVGGTGLGLAIAESVVELHGGTITAESGEEGATFTITLPATRSRARTLPARTRVGAKR
jgi:two-component system, OmpR family, sensor histidine kinase BaeS